MPQLLATAEMLAAVHHHGLKILVLVVIVIAVVALVVVLVRRRSRARTNEAMSGGRDPEAPKRDR